MRAFTGNTRRQADLTLQVRTVHAGAGPEAGARAAWRSFVATDVQHQHLARPGNVADKIATASPELPCGRHVRQHHATLSRLVAGKQTNRAKPISEVCFFLLKRA